MPHFRENEIEICANFWYHFFITHKALKRFLKTLCVQLVLLWFVLKWIWVSFQDNLYNMILDWQLCSTIIKWNAVMLCVWHKELALISNLHLENKRRQFRSGHPLLQIWTRLKITRQHMTAKPKLSSFILYIIHPNQKALMPGHSLNLILRPGNWISSYTNVYLTGYKLSIKKKMKKMILAPAKKKLT